MIDWDKVYRYLVDTNYSPEHAINYFDLNVTTEELEEAMLNRNLEQCPFCDYWCESGELVDDDGEIVGCDQCRQVS